MSLVIKFVPAERVPESFYQQDVLQFNVSMSTPTMTTTDVAIESSRHKISFVLALVVSIIEA